MDSLNDEMYMRRCLELAEIAAKNTDIPVGAVIVRQCDGKIIGEGFNKRELDRSPLAHAEIIAINEASKALGGWRLIGCTLYVTLEPCAMCAGAVVNSRIDRLVYGADDYRFGACGSCFELFSQGLNHTPIVKKGVLKDECSRQLSDFFKRLREEKKTAKEGKVNG